MSILVASQVSCGFAVIKDLLSIEHRTGKGLSLLVDSNLAVGLLIVVF